jgi:hypothetical protein
VAVECASAVARAEREGSLTLEQATTALARPAALVVVTFDERLETAALREGFSVLVPGRPPPASPEKGGSSA